MCCVWQAQAERAASVRDVMAAHYARASAQARPSLSLALLPSTAAAGEAGLLKRRSSLSALLSAMGPRRQSQTPLLPQPAASEEEDTARGPPPPDGLASQVRGGRH